MRSRPDKSALTAVPCQRQIRPSEVGGEPMHRFRASNGITVVAYVAGAGEAHAAERVDVAARLAEAIASVSRCEDYRLSANPYSEGLTGKGACAKLPSAEDNLG